MERYPVPPGLADGVLNAIRAARIRALRVRMALFGSLGILSAAYGMASSSAISQELRSSGFVSLLRLSLSDPDVFFSAWRETVFAFLESVPVLSLLVICVLFLGASGALAFFKSLRKLEPSAGAFFHHPNSV